MNPSAIPQISLVILSYNNWKLTDSCLLSLLQSFDSSLLEEGIEIILVDNGSNEQTRQHLIEFESSLVVTSIEFRLFLLDENLGYPCGINFGLKHCRGSIIGVLNNDLLFPPNWLTPLVHLLKVNKSVGFAAPFLSFAPSVQHIPQAFNSFHEMQQFAAQFMSTHSEQILYTEKVVGACLLFRRELLDAIGGNDYWYGIGNYDDDDWCVRARIAGFQIAVVGGSYLYHVGHGTFRHEPTLFQASLQANLVKFSRKWSRGSLDPLTIHTSMVKAKTFNRDRHFIPIHFSDFNDPAMPIHVHRSAIDQWFLCADWTDAHSGWPSTFISIVQSNLPVHLILWVPQSLFDVRKITDRINSLILSSEVNDPSTRTAFTILHEDIPYVETARFIRSHDAVVNIPNDFVNRYMIGLARHMEMSIVSV